MNNTCPSCGALYNVAEKDIGRRLKCKKCHAALMVTEAGLVLADDDTARDAAPRADRDVPEADDEPVVRNKPRRPRGDPLAGVGGVPGLLFGIGVTLVLLFTFLQTLSAASNLRASEYVNKLALEEQIKIRELLPKGKKDRSDLDGDAIKTYDDGKKKIEDEYAPKKRVAEEEKLATEIGNKRSRLYEGYGAMVGFVLVAFGCLGFLRSQDAMLLRVVAGIILTGLVLGLFRAQLGGGAGVGAMINIG